jgi:hypothetical protein
MTARFGSIVAWLVAGHAALFGLFWLLLRVPESNVVMLLVSAFVALAVVVIAGVIQGAALHAWAGTPWAQAVRRALGALLPFLAGLLLFGLIWWLSGLGWTWWKRHIGEVNAWLMLRFGWTRTSVLHRAVEWLVAFVRYVFAVSLALALVVGAIRHGAGSLLSGRWIREGAGLRRLAVVAGLMWLFVWLPWQGVYWRPKAVAPNWQELVFVSLKLGVIYLLANVGWALVLGAAVTGWPGRTPVARLASSGDSPVVPPPS